ncbi:MAG TPA: MFS transporter [Chloroflexota bacterium]|nr:MFS transporter [Chloroflexota bacterium]
MTEPGGRRRLSSDFWKFWTGQVISQLGTSFTAFAVPLLIYHLTHSAMNLAITMAAEMLPYLLFGLVIGAWVDRLDRKRMMIGVSILQALVIGSIPAINNAGGLSVWWIYGVAFVNQTLFIFFNAGEFAAIPSLVGKDNLVTANGRIQASYFATTVLGPLMAGGLSAFIPIPDLLAFDAVSYLVSAGALATVRRSFNDRNVDRLPTTIRRDVVEGLRYVLGHPVLRNISMMMAAVNFVTATTAAQLVLFAKDRFHASNAEIGLLFGVGGCGVVIFSLAAGRLRRRWSFSVVALGSLTMMGAMTVAFALVPWYWVAIVFWGLESGFGSLFNIQTGSLRQSIVPNHLLGRVMTIAGVLAWSAIPLGALIGGFAIVRTHNVVLVYTVIGALTVLIPLLFSLTPLGHAEDYVPKDTVLPDHEATQAIEATSEGGVGERRSAGTG